jgi:argininosuccinate synthase
MTARALERPKPFGEVEIEFARGVPVGLDGRKLDPVALIEKLEGLGAVYGIGRGIHLGDTIIGTKGRVAFEAPAAEILISAHRELEKLTLTLTQSRVKELVSAEYGQLIHEGKQLDPACRDIEALYLSSQARVTGKVRVQLRPGSLFVLGVTSPHSLMAASRGKYGEAAGEWTAADALGFSKIMALPGMFHTRAKGE